MAIVISKTTSLDATIQIDNLSGVTFTNENGGHVFQITCTRGGVVEDLTGSVTARFMRSNNSTVLLGGSIVGGKAQVTLLSDCYNVPGRFQLSIFVTDNSATTCIYAGIGSVSRTQAGALIDSGELIPSIEELTEMLDDVADAMEGAETVNISQTQSNHVVTITTTDRTGQQTSTNINSDLSGVLNTYSTEAKNINVVAGTAHQKNVGPLVVSISEGTEFETILTSDVAGAVTQYSLFYRVAGTNNWDNAIERGITEIGKVIKFVAPVDIDAIGLYVTAANVVSSATLTLTARYLVNNDTLEHRIEVLEDYDLDAMAQSVSVMADDVANLKSDMSDALNDYREYSKEFSATAGTAIQHANSKLDISIDGGVSFDIKLSSNVNNVPSKYAVYYRANGETAFTMIEGGIEELDRVITSVAPTGGIDAVAVYALGANVGQNATLTLTCGYLVNDDTLEHRVELLEAEDFPSAISDLDNRVTALETPGIIELNQDVEPLVQDIGRKRNTTLTNQSTYTSLPDLLVLAHMSDIHGDGEGFQRFMEWCDAHSAYINDRIITGDILWSNSTQSMNFFDAVDGHSNVLLTLGNHDQTSPDATGDNAMSEGDAYTKFFAPYISNWGVVHPDNHTYWYKDYTSAGIRLIGLNTNYRDTTREGEGDLINAQITWLDGVLADARTNDLAVVIAQHYPISAYSTGSTVYGEPIDCNFQAIDKDLLNSARPRIYDDYVQAVNRFIQAGGEFICWIGGHTHCDLVLKHIDATTNIEQLSICVTTQCNNSSNSGTVCSDTNRVAGTKSRDGFNLIAFDRTTKTVKLVRIGANTDIYLRQRNGMTITYQARNDGDPKFKVISEC